MVANDDIYVVCLCALYNVYGYTNSHFRLYSSRYCFDAFPSIFIQNIVACYISAFCENDNNDDEKNFNKRNRKMYIV